MKEQVKDSFWGLLGLTIFVLKVYAVIWLLGELGWIEVIMK